MSIVSKIIYGFISGIVAAMPVSEQANQTLLLRLFGEEQQNPLLDLVVHIAILLAIISGCRSTLSRLRREQKNYARSKRLRNHIYDTTGIYDVRLVKTAAIPLVIGLILFPLTRYMENNLLYISAFSIVNGIFLLVQEHVRHGNKDSRSMTGFDGLLMGASGALSVLPGISRNGMIMTAGVMRGADKEHVMRWTLLLCLPAFAVMIGYDVVGIINHGVGTLSFQLLIGHLIAAAAAYCGGILSVLFMRSTVPHSGFSSYAYYSWGVALFSFILYLIA